MDLSNYNARARAEMGIFVQLCDPYTGDPIQDGDKRPGFRVRGVASKSVQQSLAEMQRKAKKGVNSGEMDDTAAMEMLHERLVESAMRYIISAVDLEHDGKPVGSDRSLIRAVLDYTFPDMVILKEDDGRPKMIEATTDEGKKVTVPQMDVANRTFAAQVIEAAENGKAFLGNSETA